MALKKCKECGKEVSTEAKACPNCGAKPPGRTSAFTWFVLFALTAVAIYFLGSDPDTTPAGKAKTKPVRSAEFQTMRSCLEGIKKSSGQTLDVVTDEPTEVSGFLSNRKGFACQLKSTGTKGTYYHGWYIASDTQIQAERKEKLADEESARKRKIADDQKAEQWAVAPHSKWSDSTARTTCARDLHSTYNYKFAINTFMGMQPHENHTTLVGLALIDKRPEYDVKNVTAGCVYSFDGTLVTIFFNTKIAGWAEPPKR
jgi:hypothetical protein